MPRPAIGVHHLGKLPLPLGRQPVRNVYPDERQVGCSDDIQTGKIPELGCVDAWPENDPERKYGKDDEVLSERYSMELVRTEFAL